MLRINHPDYPIFIHSQQDSNSQFQKYLQGYSSIQLICDSNTEKFCLPIFENYLANFTFQKHVFPAGEANKNNATLQNLYANILKNNADRNALIINLGGGVVSDLGGFTAATYKRGIDFIQVPTSLLAMVDATIGGKLGYNFLSVKNAIGCFANPKAVLINTVFLQSLSKDERLSGWAEMLKHALISDADYWKEMSYFDIEKEKDIPLEFIEKSLNIKLKIVIEDPFEKGARKLLNLGHSLGHALESAALEKKEYLPHGVAVAFGILGESYFANKKGILANADFEKIKSYLLPLYANYFIDKFDLQAIISWIKNDKKNSSGKFNFTLLREIGKAEQDHFLNIQDIELLLNWLNNNYEV